jgi:hypothetical protein
LIGATWVPETTGEPVPMELGPVGIKMPGGLDLEFTLTTRTTFTTDRVVTVRLDAILVPKDFHLHNKG